MENVPALLVRGMDVVLGSLAEIGFDCEWHCVPAATVGAPHLRNRIFIFANSHREGLQGSEGTGSAGEEGQPAGHTPERGHSGTRRAVRTSTVRPMGGVVDGVSFGLDGHWKREPADSPRLTVGEINRTKKLRCLGNAVVPQVAELVGKWVLTRIEKIESI